MAMKYSANNALLSNNGVSTTLDNDGNMTSVVINGNKFNFTYDSQNHLVKANDDVYKYDAEDYRIQANETKYAYDRQNKNLLVKYDADGTIEKFVYGVGLISSERPNNDVAIYHYDLRGSVTAITNKEGAVTDRYSYSTYGKQSHDEGNRVEIFGYNGRDGVVTEANGLIYMRARYYSPELKRFINADVVKGEIGKSNTLNRYAYVEGNPATLIDPFGLSAEPGTKSNKSSFNWSEGIHTALDAGGFIPGLGNICDGANALYYLIQGDFGNAGLSAISLIPFGDYFAKGGKYAVKIGSNVVEAGIKHADDVVKIADKPKLVMNLQLFAETGKGVSKVDNIPGRGYHKEVYANKPVKVNDAVSKWEEFLGPGKYTDIHPRTGLKDPDRIFSADGKRSIRFGSHEMNSKPTKFHYHEEIWTYDPINNVMNVDNTVVRVPYKK